ncbi:N5-carboxyaminoimidazole ribonucleotide synthase [Mycobacterium tuberculosis]|nr:N5-carboxyaminoimidazole ribonucleotide synthase [Mycobacterium tuberculosis]
MATGPVWPPPSPPCTIIASAPQAATLRACLAAPIDGMTTAPASLSRAISCCLGANANEATRTPSRIINSTRSPASAASARMFTPNGLSVTALTFVIAAASSSSVMVAEAKMPSPPALAVADTSRAPATQPIPVCTTGCSMPMSSVSGVRSLIATADNAVGVPPACRGRSDVGAPPACGGEEAEQS